MYIVYGMLYLQQMHNRLPDARGFLAETDKDAILSVAVFLLLSHRRKWILHA